MDFLNGSDFLDTLNHTIVFYNYFHLPALYSIASTMIDCAIWMQLHSRGLVKNLRHDGLCSKDAITFPRFS